MSTKEEKPTLAGVTVKTRKRNIVVPQDPKSFADAVITIVQDAGDGASTEADLEAAGRALDSAELEYSRYADTLFEVLFAGGRLGTGAQLAEADDKKLAINIFAAAPEREAILPYVKLFQSLTRRRPFLIRGLENTLVKLLLSLEFLEDDGRKKIAITLALVYSMKLGVLPENIFAALLNDRLVAKGTVQDLITIFFKEFLSNDNSMDELVSILTKGKVVNRLLDLMPPSKRTPAEFNAHFRGAGLDNLVEWNTKRDVDTKVDELQEALVEAIMRDPPMGANEVLVMAKAKKAEHDLPDVEVLRVSWLALMKTVNMTGKNQQQVQQAIIQKLKVYHKLMSTFASSTKAELQLLLTIQVYCYEDNRLLKIFTDIVRMLYDAEIVGEDTIQFWYKKGSHPKGRNVFLKDIEPFIKWLEEAESDEDED